jgi:histidyl-tRNA synthetase
MLVSETLRRRMPSIRVELNLGGGSFKSQLKRADRSGASLAVILGEDEVARGEAGLKPLRTSEEQSSVALDDLAERLAERLRQ